MIQERTFTSLLYSHKQQNKSSDIFVTLPLRRLLSEVIVRKFPLTFSLCDKNVTFLLTKFMSSGISE